MQSYLSGLKADIQERNDYSLENLGPLLVVLGQPDKDGSIPGVQVRRFPIEGGLLVQTDGDSSMEALVGAEMFVYEESEWSVESLTEDRAYVTLHLLGTDMPLQRHIVFMATQEYMYEFYYTYVGRPDAVLEAVFAASVHTAAVKPPYDVPKQTVDQEKYAQDADCEGLVENAKHAIEEAYSELGTCDPSVVTPNVLNEIQPSIVFVVVSSAEAALAPEAATVRNEVRTEGMVASMQLVHTLSLARRMASSTIWRTRDGTECTRGGQSGSNTYEIPVDD